LVLGSSSKKRKVVFDSSFLMALAETPTRWSEDIADALGSFDPVILVCVRDELEELARAGGGRSRLARVALSMSAEFEGMECGGAEVDDEIVSAAVTLRAAVATLDEDLMRTLRASRVVVVSLRGGRVWVR
jgi:rRNA-processing protein FCF1